MSDQNNNGSTEEPPTKLGRRFTTTTTADTTTNNVSGGLATPTPTGVYGGVGGATPSSVYGGDGTGNNNNGPGVQTASFSSSHWGGGGGATPSMHQGGGGGMTPAMGGGGGGLFSSLAYGSSAIGGATPTPGASYGGQMGSLGGATPTPMQPSFMSGGGAGGFTPAMGDGQFGSGGVDFGGINLPQTTTNTSSVAEGEAALAAVQSHRIDERAKVLESTYDYRNRYLTDDDINDILGDALASEFQCVDAPSSYVPLVSSNGTSAKPNFIAIARAELEQELRAELQLRAGIFQQQPTLSGVPGGVAGGGGAFLIPESMGEGLPNVKPSDAVLFEVLLKYHGIEDDADIPAHDLPLVLTMRCLLKIKNGDSIQRKAGIKFLTTKVDVLGVDVVMPAILCMWEGGYLDLPGKHYIVKLLLRLIYRLSTTSNTTAKNTNGGLGSDSQHPFAAYATELVGCVETLLSEPDASIRDDGRDLISLLAQYLGLKTIFAAIRNDVTHEDDGVRRNTAKVIAIVGQALGPEHLAHILRPCAASESHLSRHTAVKAIYESCALLEHGLLPVLPDLAGVLSDLLTDSSNRVKGDAAHALAALADAVAPHGYAALRPLVGVVREFCRHSTGEGKLVTAFLRALGSLIPLMPAADAQRNTRDVMPALVHKFNTPDDEVRRVVLRVVYQCISATGYLGGGGAEATGFLDALFSGFWAQKRAAADPKTRRLLVSTTEEAAARYASSGGAGGAVGGGGGTQGGGASEVLSRLIPFLQDEFEDTQAMAVEAAHGIMLRCGITGVPKTLSERIGDSLMAALYADQEGKSRTVVKAIALHVNASGTLFLQHVFRFVDKLQARLGSPHHGIRTQAADLVAAVIPTIVIVCQAVPQGKAIMRALYQQLDSAEGAVAIVSYVKALKECLRALGPLQADPTPKELLSTMSHTLGNRENAVQFHTVELIEDLAPYCRAGSVANPQYAAWAALVSLHKEINFSSGDVSTKKKAVGTTVGHATSSRSRAIAAAAAAALQPIGAGGASASSAGYQDFMLFLPAAPSATIRIETPLVKAADLHAIAMTGGLYDLLGSDRRATRRVCARAFGVIAANTGAFLIVGELINNFTVDKRKVRICTSVALSVIASTCQPFTVIPYLINEYRACESTEACTIVQHTILKTIRFIFEEIGPQGRDYILPLIPLLERAVTTGGGDGGQMRRMAIEAMRAMVNAIAASGSIGAVGANVISATPHDNGAFCEVVTHMLNFAHPNIVELLAKKAPVVSDERMRLVTVVVQFFESCRAVVGSAVIFQYLAAGLYHPSAMVRDVYWRTYNIVYLAAPEALVPCYPAIDDIGPIGVHLDDDNDDNEDGTGTAIGGKRPRGGEDLNEEEALELLVSEPIRPYRRHEALYL